MSGSDHLNPAQFGEPQEQCDDDDTDCQDEVRRARDAAREASKARHPSRTAPVEDQP